MFYEELIPLQDFIDKDKKDFAIDDIVKYAKEFDVNHLNFHYVAEDGRVKTLNFIIQNENHLREILSAGERVDGSSLFKYLESGSSDLYVIPKIKSAFLNPFEQEPTLGFFCKYFDKNGYPTPFSPENILINAEKSLEKEAGIEMHGMGELEYYVIYPKESLYVATDQRGYHESMPFVKYEDLRLEALNCLKVMGASIKYAHSEVGNFTDDKYCYEQNEIEFLPVALDDAAIQLITAKWVLRVLGYKYGVQVSFAPKITVGKAGSGMHIHMKLLKDGKNVVFDENGEVSEISKKAIAGIMELAPSLTAFGNCVPTSYLRLEPNQEAPTKICWGERNRSALVRVPLGWSKNAVEMFKIANEGLEPSNVNTSQKPTFEFRVPDGSADIYLLISALAVAVREGLSNPNALQIADKFKIEGNIFREEYKDVADKLPNLPTSCVESSKKLQEQKAIYTKNNVFPSEVIDYQIKKLQAFNDENLSQKIQTTLEPEKTKIINDLVNKFINC